MRNINATLLSSKRTSIFVAHRLRTISDADFIFVLRDGAVLEAGRHEELIGKGGLYTDLWESQASSGVGGPEVKEEKEEDILAEGKEEAK
ncbi:unnamed protein product [Tilletia controversa]|nr:unnamed protein product [Tilletia controversa]CAD6980196.1 unnamed protein product [Tilletia controversa]